MTLDTIEGELDVQIKEAITDITNSFKMISNLESLRNDLNVDKKSLIQFHKIRIRNCLNALLKEVTL